MNSRAATPTIRQASRQATSSTGYWLTQTGCNWTITVSSNSTGKTELADHFWQEHYYWEKKNKKQRHWQQLQLACKCTTRYTAANYPHLNTMQTSIIKQGCQSHKWNKFQEFCCCFSWLSIMNFRALNHHTNNTNAHIYCWNTQCNSFTFSTLCCFSVEHGQSQQNSKYYYYLSYHTIQIIDTVQQ